MKILFLRVHHLIVALLKLPVNVDILYVETGQMLESFIRLPPLHYGGAIFILLCRNMLHLDLLLQVIDGILQL